MPSSRQFVENSPIGGIPAGYPREKWPTHQSVETVRPDRSFWQTYTPRNIAEEIRRRISALVSGRKKASADRPSRQISPEQHARNVGEFYDLHHDDFMQVYGEVIQAFRTRNIADLLNYQINSIGFQPGQRVLDAGCGVATPAIHFARHAQVQVDAITVSKVQYEVACEKVRTANLSQQVSVVHGDYHNLDAHFPPGVYDVVYFLESFGHSNAKDRLIDACWKALKPGGVLYIKDLFRRVPLRPEHKDRIDREIGRINEAYRYEVSDLNVVLDYLRGKGFVLVTLKSIDFPLAQFEDLAISNKFQELTGLAVIENWDEYVFPVEFFELKCMKPEFGLDERPDRDILQNRYHRSVEGVAGEQSG